MSSPQFDVERATAGLVMALFLAASLLLGAMYYFVLRDANEQSDTSSASQAVRVEEPPAVAASPPSVSLASDTMTARHA